jgi:uncharacterized membrane protein YgcG
MIIVYAEPLNRRKFFAAAIALAGLAVADDANARGGGHGGGHGGGKGGRKGGGTKSGGGGGGRRFDQKGLPPHG